MEGALASALAGGALSASREGAEDSGPDLILWVERLALFPVKGARELHRARKSATAMLFFGT